MYILDQACGKFSYQQKKWIDLYRKAENESMSRKLEQRASDLSQELTKQFLLKKRTKAEWDFISLIQNADMDTTDTNGLMKENAKIEEHYNYTALHEWAHGEAKENPGMKSAFDFLDDDEMTFNENENAPAPPVSVHILKMQMINDTE